MKIVAVIAEFNPFHNGHNYLLETIKKSCPDALCIALMSGSFTQRGGPAVFDKWQRAKLAVLGGFDIILELPAVFAVRSAQGFAQGGIRLLQELGCVDTLCFGSENDELPKLQKIASLLNGNNVGSLLREKMRNGLSYAAAMEEITAVQLPGKEFSLKEPNTILGIEYLKAMEKYHVPFKAMPVKRKYAQHNNNEFTGIFSSATALRCLLREAAPAEKIFSAVPPDCCTYLKKIYSEDNITFQENLARGLLMKLRSISMEEIKKFPGVNGGLEYKIPAAAAYADSIKALLTGLKSKNYHYTRLLRALAQIMLGLTQRELADFDSSGPLYARVLAFDKNGRKILKICKETSSLPFVLKTTDFITQKQFWQRSGSKLQNMLSYDIASTDLQALSYNEIKKAGRDFVTSPCYIE